MKPFHLALSALLLGAVTTAGAQTSGSFVVCESKNNVKHTCRANVDAGVVMVRQLSENPCILGRTWGTTRDGKAIWVDHGCRGEFAIGAFTAPASAPAGAPGRVTCESINNRTQRCPADTGSGVRIARQISSNECVLGRSWGFDRGGVWVARGCRAEFALGTVPMTSASTRPVVLCASVNNGRAHCRADTRFGVSMVRQMSRNACVAGRTWGYDSDGVWVRDGCRAEFVLTSTP
ncbi:MAG TPA: DUF3011 domain-containing protein [Thermoanaerobaculia bacterium]|nr:DUF3011 domain-containing protein [Thermoanaerobaculia bacterium]